jgi:aminopeptidase N
MKDPRPQPIFRRDYRPPDYWIDAVELTFELGEDVTHVTAVLSVRRNEKVAPAPLVLDGEKLRLVRVEIDGRPLADTDYLVEERTLRIADVPDRFTLTTVVEIEPQNNTELSGLYRSGATFCTQCEAEGFRRITYFLDRPDVMATYRTTIVADAGRYPVLLSNGNRVEQRDLGDGRQLVRWEDPFPKPSYLFALVAADLRAHAGPFTTKSGRQVRLEIWVEERNLDSCEHALRSLQKAMKWDEEVFGLEYDLDVYMIVAVSDFNMAAMENKGLNVFNAKYVLARPDTATDEDYEDIEAVIAHEYFHNWTGNRVTCRDWFQLTLKEGLTVFRDEQFTADMTSAAVKRIRDVRLLRTSQFAEDGSPTAHAIRPDSYIEMNNFYTVTVYNKGAEVVRMYQTLLGRDGFRRGMDLYFERHDGQAVTCDDFRAAMADANGVDLDQFGLWYAQHGTPIVEAEGAWESDTQQYRLTLRQRAPANLDASTYRPMHIPVAVGLVGRNGEDLALHVSGAKLRDRTAVLELREAEQTFTFERVAEAPVPSLLRHFSAPVKLAMPRTREQLAFLMAHDSDAFSRWDAAQTLATELLLEMCEAGTVTLEGAFVDAFGRILDDPDLDGSLKALSLRLPDERLLGQEQAVVDVDGLFAAREAAVATLANAHRERFWAVYEQLHAETQPYRIDRVGIDGRRLKNLALGYLVASGDAEAIVRALEQFRRADNMTDAQSALGILADTMDPAADAALAEFYDKWRDDPLVIDKWFSVQALSSRPDTVDRVIALSEHRDFTLKNPNRARSLLGVFSARNQVRFNGVDGRGYALLADKILDLDRMNPQVAARLVGAFTHWRRFDEHRRNLMRTELQRIATTKKLSTDVYELTTKCLGDD